MSKGRNHGTAFVVDDENLVASTLELVLTSKASMLGPC
jgi:hypothetical protein